MKKICLIDYDMSVIGGVERVTANLANAFSDNYEVHLLSLCQKDKLAYDLNSNIKYSVILDDEKRLRDMRREAKFKLIDYINKNSINYVVIQGNYAGFIVSSISKMTKAKLIFCDHGALMNQWNRIDMLLIRFISSFSCHYTVTLTEQNKKDYNRKFFVPKRKLRCIYNWIEFDVEKSDNYNIFSKKIISAGRFSKEKGFDMLIKAFSYVVKIHDEWHLDLYGDGEMIDEIRKLIKELNLQNNVSLMGMTKNLINQYKNYAMYVLPSYREGMPLVLLEAKLNRLPIISFDILTGPKEIVQDGIDGILIPPYDIEKFAQAICYLIENPKIRENMSEKSQDNLYKFSKETILDQWKRFIDEI